MALNKREKGESAGTVDQKMFFRWILWDWQKTHNKKALALWPKWRKKKKKHYLGIYDWIQDWKGVTPHLTSAHLLSLSKKPQEAGRSDILKAAPARLDTGGAWWIDLAVPLIDILPRCHTGLSPWLLTAICCGRLLFASGAQRRPVWRQRDWKGLPGASQSALGLSSHCLTPMGCGHQGEQRGYRTDAACFNSGANKAGKK